MSLAADEPRLTDHAETVHITGEGKLALGQHFSWHVCNCAISLGGDVCGPKLQDCKAHHHRVVLCECCLRVRHHKLKFARAQIQLVRHPPRLRPKSANLHEKPRRSVFVDLSSTLAVCSIANFSKAEHSA